MDILLGLALLILGMAVIGAQFQNSRTAAYETERFYQAVLLAESKLSEIDSGLVTPEERMEEDFGRLFPNYGWRMEVQPTAVADLFLIKLGILFAPRRNPDEAFDFDNAEVVQTVYTMRATPARIDLTADFGMSQEQADKLDAVLGSLSEFGSTARDFDPRDLTKVPLEDLIDMLPSLLQVYGVKLEDVLDMLPPELRETLQAAQSAAEGEEQGTDAAAETSGSVDGGRTIEGRGAREGEAAPDEGEGRGAREPRDRRGSRRPDRSENDRDAREEDQASPSDEEESSGKPEDRSPRPSRPDRGGGRGRGSGRAGR